jgi:anti-sigma factor RsiW
MNCHEARDMIHPYVDGELDVVKTLEIETHIRGCAGCTAVHQNIAALRSSIRDGSVYFRAPVGLERRIRLNMPRPLVVTRRSWLRNWVPAAAAVVLIATMTWVAARRVGGGPEMLLASEVTSAHVRSLMAEHLWDIKSTDQHTVKPWFDGKLNFAPDVRDFKDESFSLEGGRLDYLAGRPVAALVYRHEKHYINLFVWPAAGQSEQGEVGATQQGYALLHWVHAGMECWAISDMSADVLRRFSSVVREGGRAPTKPRE